MLEIRNSAGMVLDLPVDSRISIEINSTIFDTDDIIRGSYSYPFKFGLNENNLKFIQFGHLPEKPGSMELAVQAVAGTHLFKATLVYKTSGFFADANLLIDLGAIADTIRNQPLREFVTETFFISDRENTGGQTLKTLASADPGVFPVVFPPFYNRVMVDEDFRPVDSNNAPIEDYKRPEIHNYFFNWAQIYRSVPSGTGERLLVPMVYLSWLLTYICKKLGFSAQGTFFSDPILTRLIIYNSQAMPGYDLETEQYKVEVGRHLGDYTIADFLKKLRAYIGLSIDVDVTRRLATFNTYKSLYQSTGYTDLSDCLVPNSEGNDGVGNTGFVVNNFYDSSDRYAEYEAGPWTNHIQPRQFRKTYSFSTGNSATEVDLGIGTLMMATFSTPVPTQAAPVYQYLLPSVEQDGNLADVFFQTSPNYAPYYDSNDPSAIPPSVNPFGLRMLVYWGLQQDTGGNYYPYASSVSYNSKYLQVGQLSLQAGEPDDLWNLYQKKYYEFLSGAKKISALMRISLGKLSEISPSTPVGYRGKNFVTGRYLLEKLTYELPDTSGFVLAKFEGRQLVPKILEASAYTDPQYASWVQLKMENTSNGIGDPSNNERSYFADIVAYIWKDGLFTVPEPNKGLTFNFRRFVTTFDVNQISKEKYTDESIYISGHRTVIESQVLYQQAGQPQGLKYFVAWAPRDGEGYRTR